MLASYLLSVTLVLTLAKYWLKPHSEQAAADGILARFQAGFDRLRARYHSVLEACLRSGPVSRVSFSWPRHARQFSHFRWDSDLPGLGQDFFPSVDSGQIMAPCARQDGSAHRGNGGTVRCHRRDDPPEPSRRPNSPAW